MRQMAEYVIFIGDRLSAAGFRLAGMRIAPPREAEQCLSTPPEDAALLVISAEILPQIDKELLSKAQRRLTPGLLVVPDVRGRHAPDDTAARLKRQLGMAE